MQKNGAPHDGDADVQSILGSFFLRLSHAKSMLDVNTVAGIAEQELGELGIVGFASVGEDEAVRIRSTQ